MQKDSGYPPPVAYYAEEFELSTKFRMLCRIILSIHLLRDLMQKLSAY